MAFLFRRKFKCTNNTIIKNDVYIAKRLFLLFCYHARHIYVKECLEYSKICLYRRCDFKCINISFCKEPRCGKVDAVCSIDRPYLLLYRPCTFEWFLVNEKWKLDFVWERHGKGSPYSYYPCTIPQLFLESFCQCVN